MTWGVVCGSIAAHLALFFTLRHWLSARIFGAFYARLSERDKLRWNERSVAFLHALFSSQGSCRALFAMLPAPLTVDNLVALDCAHMGPGQELADWYLSVTLGYFLYDSAIYATVARANHGFVDWAHHIISEVQYSLHVSLRFAYLTPTALQTNELSTPWIHLSWFLGKAHDHGAIRGPAARVLLDAAQIVFATLFFLCRVLFNTLVALLALRVVRLRSCPADVPVAAQLFSLVSFGLYMVVQYFWFAAILRKLVSALSGKGSSWPSEKKGSSVSDGTPKSD